MPHGTIKPHVLAAITAEVARRSPARLNAIGDDSLPPKVAKAFVALGHAQRHGAPEHVMLQYQFTSPGVLGAAVEHVGDLTHRMTEWADQWQYDGGYGAVREKVDRVLGWLQRSMYGGFEREHRQNLRNNAPHWAEKHGKPEALFDNAVKQRLAAYANAHAALPVYNEAQWLAREAAVKLGREDFDGAERKLERLKARLGSASEWKEYASRYRLGADGEPLRYPW